jgi:DNA polymerase-4
MPEPEPVTPKDLDKGSKQAERGSETPQRKIIHVDMDAFYASVEQRDNPELRGKPVAVGGERARGVVAAASYEARRFGVHSALASITAKRRCPDLIFVKPRFDVYKTISGQIRDIFKSHTPLVEPLSLDEAYLDVTENLKGIATATKIAKQIRAEIRSVTGLTASAGVSYNKFLAKMASDQRKPDGLFVILPEEGAAFVEALPVGKFHGIGPATDAKMAKLGIRTGAGLKVQSLEFLAKHFGKAGPHYYWISRGIDERKVKANRVRKSVGAENTFADDIVAFEAARAALKPIIEKVCRHCERTNIRGRTLTLKAKYADFQQITRSRTFEHPIASRDEIEEIAFSLLQTLFPVAQGIRLLGVTLSSLGEENTQSVEQLRLAI